MSTEKVQVIEHVLVLGSGNFGTCLAFHLATQGHIVHVWGRDPNVAKHINEKHKNPKYLSNIDLPENIIGVGPEFPDDLFEKTTVILFCIPTQYLRDNLHKLKNKIQDRHLLIFANKGIEMSTLLLPCEIVSQELGKTKGENSVFLSGPSFAVEVVQKEPTCVTVASKKIERAKWAQRIVHTKFFRVYTTSDVIGVELAGSLKNVIAIACGITAGLGFQMNARAALLTRGVSEIGRLSVKLCADPITLLTLAGIGDLFLTCTSEKSRNFTVGFRIGKGEKLEHIIQSLGSVAEGVPTTKAAHELCAKLGIYLPIIETVYKILYENVGVGPAVEELLELGSADELVFQQ